MGLAELEWDKVDSPYCISQWTKPCPVFIFNFCSTILPFDDHLLQNNCTNTGREWPGSAVELQNQRDPMGSSRSTLAEANSIALPGKLDIVAVH